MNEVEESLLTALRIDLFRDGGEDGGDVTPVATATGRPLLHGMQANVILHVFLIIWVMAIIWFVL